MAIHFVLFCFFFSSKLRGRPNRKWIIQMKANSLYKHIYSYVPTNTSSENATLNDRNESNKSPCSNNPLPLLSFGGVLFFGSVAMENQKQSNKSSTTNEVKLKLRLGREE